jgi:hypothetical protein
MAGIDAAKDTGARGPGSETKPKVHAPRRVRMRCHWPGNDLAPRDPGNKVANGRLLGIQAQAPQTIVDWIAPSSDFISVRPQVPKPLSHGLAPRL